MKIIFGKSALVRALSKLRNAADNGVKIVATEEAVTLTGVAASGQGVQITMAAEECEIKRAGEMLVDYKYITESVKKLDGNEVTIQMADGVCLITDGKSKYKLRTMELENFPLVSFKYDERSEKIDFVDVSILVEDLASLIDATKYSMGTKDTRPILTGLNFISAEQRLTAYATDSYRLSRKWIEYDGPDFNVTVPARAITVLEDVILKDMDPADDITISIMKRAGGAFAIYFISENTIIRSTLLEGAFPELERMIPTEFASIMKISRQSLRGAVERPIFMRSRDGAIERMILRDDELILRTAAQEIGASEEHLNASYEGENLDLSFNADYLLDALKSVREDTVVVKFAGAMKPVVITSEEDPTNIQLFLPVRTAV